MSAPPPTLVLVKGAAPAPGPAAPEPATDPRGDDELMRRAAGGDRRAFETLVRHHQDKVVAFGMRFFGQRALALDVAQEVFVDLLRALPRYRGEGRFRVYLYRITINRCRMAARRLRYEERGRGRWARGDDEAVSPDEAAARERQRHLSRAMAELPEKQRAVLQLRFWGGLSHDEIAEALGTREGTVKSRLWHALARLREQLGEELP